MMQVLIQKESFELLENVAEEVTLKAESGAFAVSW